MMKRKKLASPNQLSPKNLTKKELQERNFMPSTRAALSMPARVEMEVLPAFSIPSLRRRSQSFFSIELGQVRVEDGEESVKKVFFKVFRVFSILLFVVEAWWCSIFVHVCCSARFDGRVNSNKL